MSKLKKVNRVAWIIVWILLAVVIILGIMVYKEVYTTNVTVSQKTKQFLFIPTNSTFEDVVTILDKEKLLINEKSFRWTAHQMKYDTQVHPGKYFLKTKMSNRELIALLRSAKQTPVKMTFNNIRTKEQLALRIGEQIEAKPEAILNLLNDVDYTKDLGFTPENVLAMFIPDTYEYYWNTSADKFIKRMKKEYNKFWTAPRLLEAQKIALTPVQISVLASIVQMESNKETEKPIIAGVYINRFKKDWKLEADPTLVYALGDFSVNRILNIYKEIDSPYNTYKYKGLPPGPICLPAINSLKSVLNYVQHKYMYFCAKDDFSGFHAFASTYQQHLLNAKRFQRALDKRGIRA